MTMSRESSALIARIKAGLADVIDPELGRDVVSLGLIYTIEASDAGTVHITMTTTTIGCPAAGFLVDAVRHASATVAGVRTVDVRLTHEPRWQPEMILD